MVTSSLLISVIFSGRLKLVSPRTLETGQVQIHTGMAKKSL
jgi:hypothetical protein